MARQPHPCAKCGKPCWGTNCRGCGWAKPKAGRELRCGQCGTAFVTTDRRRGRKFCSLVCAARSRATNRISASCEVCGLEFTRKASDFARRDGNKGGRFCSKKCQGVWRSRDAASKPKPLKPPKPELQRVYFPECAICGGLFCAKTKSAKYCSDECRRLHGVEVAKARANDLYALATQFDKRTGVYVGAEWRQRLFHALVERDGDRCQICNRKVNLNLKSGTRGSRRGPSVDHIIPRSQGGSDDLVNLRLTHWGCNQKRGNRGGGEQLALVG